MLLTQAAFPQERVPGLGPQGLHEGGAALSPLLPAFHVSVLYSDSGSVREH